MLWKNFLRTSTTAATTAALTDTTTGNHGVTGRYDASRQLLSNGVVTSTTFSPPHSAVSVRVGGSKVSLEKSGLSKQYFGRTAAAYGHVGTIQKLELFPFRMFHQLEEKSNPGDRAERSEAPVYYGRWP